MKKYKKILALSKKMCKLKDRLFAKIQSWEINETNFREGKMTQLQNFFSKNNWEIVYQYQNSEREPIFRDYRSLNLSDASNKVLSKFENGIYEHQWLGIEKFQENNNVCISTSTSSGKSLIFNICALERLTKNPNEKILAVYPLKALGSEQEEKWKKIISESGLDLKVGRIDGSVHKWDRERILEESSILIMTPDVIHAWLLSSLSSNKIIKFIEKISLIVVDEAHTYSGVFGSNSAFLFRRLQHIIKLKNGDVKFIAASATIKNPEEHLKKLIGLDFEIIDNKYESSPKNRTDIILVKPPKEQDLLTSASDLMREVVNNTDHKFITFVDSRKQTEYIAAISSRNEKTADRKESIEDLSQDLIDSQHISPYRSGYEEHDRQAIQKRLTSGELRGVISTSALEMGIDIPHLTMGILFGVPNSTTSFYQRIGRIGRHQNGVILIVNNGTIQSNAVFREPERIRNLPLSESALYLNNKYIQYIHTLCLASQGGEDDSARNDSEFSSDFSSDVNFPQKFIDLSKSERVGEIPKELREMKSSAGEDPHHIFPLRDVEKQFKILFKQGPDRNYLGQLGYSQLMREAYPGAVYYYRTKAYRVTSIDLGKRMVNVRKEKQYTTKPRNIPTLIYPILEKESIKKAKKYGDLILVESELQIVEMITGYEETRGRTKEIYPYPLDSNKGIYYDRGVFKKNYFTTGVIFSHELLNNGVDHKTLINIIFEAIFLVVPYERQDIGCGNDRYKADREIISKDSKFIAVYDKTYGSLRLSGRIFEKEILKKIFDNAVEISENDSSYSEYEKERNVLKQLREELDGVEQDIEIIEEEELVDSDLVKIILPESYGIDKTDHTNDFFYIKDIFFHPRLGKLAYRGYRTEGKDEIKKIIRKGAGLPVVIVGVDSVEQIHGESRMGYYNQSTGEVIE